MAERPGKRSRHQTQGSAAAPVRPVQRAVRWPWLIAGAALLVRLVYFFEYTLSPLAGFFGPDDLYYLAWARRIVEGDWLGDQVFEQGPLYAYLIAGLMALVGPRGEVLLAVQLASGVVVALLVYECGRRLFDQATGIAAGLLAAVYGPLVFYECMLMKSFLSPLLTMIALTAGLRYGESRRGWWLAAAGMAVGLACLIQEFHILLLAPLGLWIWLADCSQRLRACHTAVLIASILLCILPCAVRNRIVAGEWVLVTAGGGEAFYIAQGPQARGFYNPPDFVLAATGQEHEDFRIEARRRTGQELSRSESSRYWFREGLRAIADDPWRTIQLAAAKAAILLNDYDVPDSQSFTAARQFVPALIVLPTLGWIGGLGLVGIALCLPCWRRYMLPLGFVAAHALPILVFYNFGRFRIGLMPLWILFAAHGGVWIVRGLRGISGTQRRWAVVALLVALTISAGMFYPLLAEDFRLTDAKFVPRLALRGGDYALAEERLREIVEILEHLPVAQSQSVQYLAQVADIRKLLADTCLRSGKWREALEQIQSLEALPLREDSRQQIRKECAAMLEAALRDPRLAPDSPEVKLLREELQKLTLGQSSS
jgi:4-amino-4-deoxy-L-arabinose transferase-like glycosyltransferase